MDNTSQNSPKAAHDTARLIELPRIRDPRGNLTFVQNGDGYLPFKVERVFWVYDVPADEERGSHAHKTGSELLVAVNGSFNVELFDGRKTLNFALNHPFTGLLIPPGYWRTINNYSSGSVCVAMCSSDYDENDYIRDFDEFLNSKKA